MLLAAIRPRTCQHAGNSDVFLLCASEKARQAQGLQKRSTASARHVASSKCDKRKACPERIKARDMCVVLQGVEEHRGSTLDAQVLFERVLVCQKHTVLLHTIGNSSALQMKLCLARKFEQPERRVRVVA
eukprot:CAMPEP_0173115736 /NCGR_PEP_ID=MMETSP1102-20130122/48751_1 /TAXON_ID=49646 /ORGANISM="Geminigera sp., Strain Caron Lab Isolate" /LENGTH=129 /DNA_ID=CAMNT_0014018975 /DNA_START=222 /DNA_END=611 /DNA_ORIENTATION=+